MAWETGTYSCGHEGRKQFYGKQKEREYAIKKHFERMCPECFRLEAAKQNEEAAARNKEAALPALTGSDKQIAWAESIRAKLVGKPDFVSALQNTSAKWWINRRGSLDNESDGAVLDRTMEYADTLMKEGKLLPPAAKFKTEGKSKYELINIVNAYIDEHATDKTVASYSSNTSDTSDDPELPF